MSKATKGWVHDRRIEAVCDKIRCGEPVGFWDALEAIEYQQRKKAHKKENAWWRRLFRAISPNRGTHR